jgi:hypothetical protein
MTITNATKVAPRDQNDDVHDNIDPAARPTRRILSVEEKLDLVAATRRTRGPSLDVKGCTRVS